jgi:hypothetical protein
MYNNNSYYEAPYDDQAEHDQLDEQVYDLVKNDPDYDPTNMSNMGEAIAQESTNLELQQFIRDCVEQKDWAKLGLKLYQVSWDYQESIAEFIITK